MMRRKLLWGIGLLLLAVVVLTVALTPQTEPESQKVRIGYLPYSSGLPFFVAQEKGFFAKEMLDITAVKVASANEAIDALRAGELDVVMGIGLSTFFAVEAAAPGSFKVFQPCVEDSTHTVSYLLVPKESKLKDAAGLRGTKVGTYSGASQVLVLRLLLKKLGLDPDDPTSVLTGDVASNLQIDALAAGQFDAFLMLEPYATTAMTLRGARPLLVSPRIQYILNPFPAGANGVSTEFMSKHPDLTHKVVAALDRAIETIHSDEDAAKAILPKYDPTLTPEIAAKAGVYRWWKQADTDIGIIQKYADLFYEGKVLKKRVDVKSMILK